MNLTGVFLCMRAEIPQLLEQGGGAIVNTSSAGGLKGFPGASAYVSAKHGVIGLTKTAALEYATQGIRINAVCPGVVDTEMTAQFTQDDPSTTEQLLDVEPVHRFGTPAEIADAVVWLLGSGLVRHRACARGRWRSTRRLSSRGGRLCL